MIQLLKYGNTNCYYIKGKNGSLLIDTDWAGTLQAFYRKIKELNIEKIDYLLITEIWGQVLNFKTCPQIFKEL